MINIEINNTVDPTQKAFYNSVLATGDLLEANQITISNTPNRVVRCKNLIGGIVGVNVLLKLLVVQEWEGLVEQ